LLKAQGNENAHNDFAATFSVRYGLFFVTKLSKLIRKSNNNDPVSHTEVLLVSHSFVKE